MESLINSHSCSPSRHNRLGAVDTRKDDHVQPWYQSNCLLHLLPGSNKTTKNRKLQSFVQALQESDKCDVGAKQLIVSH